MNYWQRLILNALSLIALAYIFPNMLYMDSVLTAFVASFTLSILNALVKPILHLLSLPITIITFGLFSLVINGFILQLTASILGMKYFYIDSFWSAFLMALILSLVNALVTSKASEKVN